MGESTISAQKQQHAANIDRLIAYYEDHFAMIARNPHNTQAADIANTLTAIKLLREERKALGR
jgi:hypothetical protein